MSFPTLEQFNSLKFGMTLPNWFLEDFINERTSVQKHGNQWVGDYVKFSGSDEEITNVNFLNLAPAGAVAYLREHYIADLVLQKIESGAWAILEIQFRSAEVAEDFI